jgi:hypothetical protein
MNHYCGKTGDIKRVIIEVFKSFFTMDWHQDSLTTIIHENQSYVLLRHRSLTINFQLGNL